MKKSEKTIQVQELKDKFAVCSAVVVADYATVNVKEMTALRRQLRKARVNFKVAKNTLTSIAIKGTRYESLSQHLVGPVVLAFADGPVDVAKILVKFAKDTNKLKIKAAFFEGQMVGPDKIKEMASLPSRQELYAMLVGSLKAPISNMVFVLSGISRKLVYVLSEIKNKKGQEGIQ